MHTATELLERQLHAYSDSWRWEQDRSIPGWELEGWLETGLSIFRLIRRLGEQLGTRGEVCGLYEQWLRNAAGPLVRLNELEGQGQAVADAAEFRDAEREARGVLQVPLDAVLGAGTIGHCRESVVPDVGQGVPHQLPA
jgi:hypothetical protein